MKGGDTMDDQIEDFIETMRLILETLQEIATSLSLLEESLSKK